MLREQGVNSHVEMAYAFTEAGFEAYDVHMTDLQTGRAKLADFKGVVACGGFSYGDTLGAGIGWARSITFNPVLADQFKAFFAPPGHLWPGRVQRLPDVCRTGRHHSRRAGLAALHHQPERALRGAPVAWWRCWSRRRCSSRAWPAAACRLPWRTARAYANFKYRGNADKAIAAMRFVDNSGAATEAYPFNPNGSPGGLTAVTTADGRFTAMMPHPERVFRNIQMSWTSLRHERVQPLDAAVAQRPQVGRVVVRAVRHTPAVLPCSGPGCGRTGRVHGDFLVGRGDGPWRAAVLLGLALGR